MATLPGHAAQIRLRMDAGWRFHLASTGTLDQKIVVENWTWAPAATSAIDGLPKQGWQPATLGRDVFHGRGFAWYRATLPSLTGTGRTVHFDGVDDNAVVYLNGRRIGSHQGYSDPFDIALDSAWNPSGPNYLLVLVENIDGPGCINNHVVLGVDRPMTLGGDPARPGYNDSHWRLVHLPHDYVVEEPVNPEGNNAHANRIPRTAWYRKTFTAPSAWRGKSVWIDFDGIYRDAKVTLNGRLLGEHRSGYTGFRYDISKFVRYGAKNVLAVFVDPTHFEGWWYEGGGIYRHVWLNVADPVHIAPWDTFISTRSVDGSTATLAVNTRLTNAGSLSTRGYLLSRALSPDGTLAAQTRSPFAIPAGSTLDIAQTLRVDNARLWSLENPRLYRLHTDVAVTRGRIVDAVDTPFGIRTIRFDAARGFFLNGKPVKIKGTCNHQDFAGVGIGVPDGLEYWRVRKLKAMGSNAWRMSHNPPTSELLDACDHLGMLVMDENRHLGFAEGAKTPPGTQNAHALSKGLSDLDSMILRDRNHPSIILWSLCNEEPLQGSDEGARIFSAMKTEVRRLDRTRLITSAMNGGFGNGISNVEDIQGFNYNPDAYDPFHRARPAQPCFASETASTVTTRGIYASSRSKGYATAYDINEGISINTAESAWKPIADRPYMAGAFVWTGFDYRGEPAPYGWPAVSSNFGIMDICGFPKDNYYFYLAAWGNRPIVHLLPHWNWHGKEGRAIDVWAYSNAPRVEILLNGRSLGVRSMPASGHVSWAVPYAPGTLLARAFDGTGKTLATDIVQTTGTPAALRLQAERHDIVADGEDVLPLAVSIVDTRGRVVPTASSMVTFTVTGQAEITGVGNGDPSDHSPDKTNRRRAFNGRCLALVGASTKTGRIVVTARSPGLRPATFVLRSVADHIAEVQ